MEYDCRMLGIFRTWSSGRFYLRRVVHWRNYEAGYDMAELEPSSRERKTYVLQEYFVPVSKFGEFVPKMAEILGRHQVNVLNVSVRHAIADPGSSLAWARTEVFAFVLYSKQGVHPVDRERVAVWTRELIDAALSLGSAYYLPYQAHATAEQFHRAYPRARDLFELTRRIDPAFRLRNVIWDTYTLRRSSRPRPRPSRARTSTRCTRGRQGRIGSTGSSRTSSICSRRTASIP
jgi:hypothetical protein